MLAGPCKQTGVGGGSNLQSLIFKQTKTNLKTSIKSFIKRPNWIDKDKKLRLHYGENRAKLAGFTKAKYFHCALKRTSLALFAQQCKFGFTNEVFDLEVFTSSLPPSNILGKSL